MKKIVILALAVCLVFAAALGISEIKSQPEKDAGNTDAAPTQAAQVTAAPAETASETTTDTPVTQEAEADIVIPMIDYEKLYAAHRPDETVMTIDGSEVSWDEYFSWYWMEASQIENYFSSMAMYGIEVGWDDGASEDYSFREYLPICIESSLAQLAAIEKNAAEQGFVKDADFEKTLAEQIKEDKVTVCGEEVSDEDFYAALAENYMSRSCYERISMANAVYSAAFVDIYGEKLEKISDEEVINMLTLNSFMYANHILIMTGDPDTGEIFEGEAKEEKLKQINLIYEQLKDITDRNELVSRFEELKELYCEDTGKSIFPKGYVFTPGTMVEEFEDTCSALNEYEISEPIETSYGYHIIMRLPLDPDVPVGMNNDGTTYNARVIYADSNYNDAISAKLDTVEIKYADGFVQPNIDEYFE